MLLDSDLAELYGVETRVLNQAIKRNLQRFPRDFMFQLTADEAGEAVGDDDRRGKHRKYAPFAFTEQGAAMLSSVLSSQRAIDVNIAGNPEAVNPRPLSNSFTRRGLASPEAYGASQSRA